MRKLADLKAPSGALLICVLVSASAWAGDSVDRGRYYGDDAWRSITEWFDGTNYKPTDANVWSWDEGIHYPARSAANYDNNRDFGSYGFFTGDNSDDWFYDYYNQMFVLPYGDTTASFVYYDYNGDGAYDAYAAFWDGGSEYYIFNDAAQERETARKQRGLMDRMASPDENRLDSKHQVVIGKIEKLKDTSVDNQNHLVAAIQDNQGKRMFVDLGEKDRINQSDLATGKQLSARGPMVHLGDKVLVLAQSVTLDGQTRQIHREDREIRGQVVAVKKATVHGDQKHEMAIIKSKTGDRKVAVDLGPADELAMQVKDGDHIAITGPIVRVNDRLVVMANSIDCDGQVAQIKRSAGPQMASGENRRSDR